MTAALVFCGAFNPPTEAHIACADYARQELGMDKVIYVPSKSRYIAGEQKKDFAFSEESRLQMLQKIAAKRDWMEVSDYELRLKRQPRTWHTLQHLSSRTGWQLKLLLGSDKLPELETGWLHIEDIGRTFGFVCLSRNGEDPEQIFAADAYLQTLRPYFTFVQTPPIYQSISSSQVRRLLRHPAENEDRIRELVPCELEGLKAWWPEVPPEDSRKDGHA